MAKLVNRTKSSHLNFANIFFPTQTLSKKVGLLTRVTLVKMAILKYLKGEWQPSFKLLASVGAAWDSHH